MVDIEWKHKVTARKGPVILCLIMFAMFASLTIWLYRVQNGAFLFTGVFSAILLLLLAVTTHRLIFFKVLIGQHEVFYQTNPFNGTTYSYRNLVKAWVSKGADQNGVRQAYCHMETRDRGTIRFLLDDPDDPGIKFMIRQIRQEKKYQTDHQNPKDQDYVIDGKVFGKTKIVIGIVIVLLVVAFDFVLVKASGQLFLEILGIIMAGYVLVSFIINYAFFRIHIGQDGFFYRTNPFNGHSFRYDEITHCKLVRKAVRIRRHSQVSVPRYDYFFEFTDKTGTKRKFQYENPLHEHEVQVLKERIESIQSNTDAEEGSTFEIKYNPENPEEHTRILEPSRSYLISSSVFGALCLIMVVMTIVLIRKGQTL